MLATLLFQSLRKEQNFAALVRDDHSPQRYSLESEPIKLQTEIENRNSLLYNAQKMSVAVQTRAGGALGGRSSKLLSFSIQSQLKASPYAPLGFLEVSIN